MNVQELGRILSDMYKKAPHGKQVAKIHLFGVKYANVIQRNNHSIKDIVAASGINISYATEVSKGIKLSEYVVPKD
ncbi:HTH-like domain-containing protein [Paenibacillus sp. YAF4_2]|uniref:HTH-like domain-containing protein n=1 Tax=Paenibacillus sp. YAF4_2 TaxID=3233085 RepID=UPI003F9B1737